MADKIILKFKTKNILNFYEIEPRSDSFNVEYNGASNGCLRVGLHWGKFHQDILQSEIRIKIWWVGPGLGC